MSHHKDPAYAPLIQNTPQVEGHTVIRSPAVDADPAEYGSCDTYSNSSGTREIHYIPKDRYRLVQITFGLLGLATLLPWNFFITADDYWKYKFRDPEQDHMPGPSKNRTQLQIFFQSYLSMASNLPFVVILVLNALFGHRVPEGIRCAGSLVMMLVIFIVTTVFVQIDTDHWQTTFFYVTMMTVVVLSSSAALFQASIVGTVSVFPPECVNPMVAGQAVAGLFAVFAQILSLAGHFDSQDAAFYYFMFANLIMGAALIGYFLMQKTKYYRYYVYVSRMSGTLSDLPEGSTEESILSSMVTIIKACWPHALTILAVFWVSLSLFPPLTTLIYPEHPDMSPWSGKYFIPITCFLLFNVGDFAGRAAAGFLPMPLQYPRLQFVLSLTRIAFIPLIMACNLHPRSLPVLFDSDFVFIFLMAGLGFTNGYLFCVAMVQGPMYVPQELREKTGFVLVAFLGTGLALGSLSSNLLLRLL